MSETVAVGYLQGYSVIYLVVYLSGDLFSLTFLSKRAIPRCGQRNPEERAAEPSVQRHPRSGLQTPTKKTNAQTGVRWFLYQASHEWGPDDRHHPRYLPLPTTSSHKPCSLTFSEDVQVDLLQLSRNGIREVAAGPYQDESRGKPEGKSDRNSGANHGFRQATAVCTSGRCRPSSGRGPRCQVAVSSIRGPGASRSKAAVAVFSLTLTSGESKSYQWLPGGESICDEVAGSIPFLGKEICDAMAGRIRGSDGS